LVFLRKDFVVRRIGCPSLCQLVAES